MPSTTPLSPAEREYLSTALLQQLPWRQGAAAHTAERFDVAEQSLLLQIQHNDLRLPESSSPTDRIHFLNEVMIPRIIEQVLRTLVQPGAPVGIESATATGRLSTQMNLNSFHSSGQLHAETLTGVPRLNEIFNCSREIKGPMMTIRLESQPHWSSTRAPHLDRYPDVPGFAAFHAFKRWTRFWFEHKTLMDFVDLEGKPPILYRPKVFAGLPNPEPYWYPCWRSVYGGMRAMTMPQTEKEAIWHTLRIKLSKSMLVQYGVTMTYIAQVLQESVLWAKTKRRLGSWTPLIHVIASPDYEATLDIHARVDHLPPLDRIYRKARIVPSRQGQILLDIVKCRELYLTQVVMYELGQIRLTGIPGLLEINWRGRTDISAKDKIPADPAHPERQWEVITRGSSLRQVIVRPQVHVPSLFTNDAFQTQDVLGIEAVRQLYLVELKACMGSVDESMFHIAVDVMMHRGIVTPANRFGAHPLDGPLTKASNEMSTQTLLRAAITHQRENLNGVSASTMLAQPIKIGTGMAQIAWDEELWLDMQAELDEQERLNELDRLEQEQQCLVSSKSTGLSSLLNNLSLATGHQYTADDVEEV